MTIMTEEVVLLPLAAYGSILEHHVMIPGEFSNNYKIAFIFC